MAKKLFLTSVIIITALLFASCGAGSHNAEQQTATDIEEIEISATYDTGVVINGIRWATRNVDMPGTFAQNPEDAGMLFQWNRRKGWTTAGDNTDWNSTSAAGDTWEKANDPCPEGWRVPLREEIRSLYNAGHEWAARNGVHGRLFGVYPYQLFLPAAGFRGTNGAHSRVGSAGLYWSSTADTTDFAWRLYFSAGDSNGGRAGRAVGASIRCVAIE